MNWLLEILIQRVLINWRSSVRALVLMLVAWLARKGITLDEGITEQLVGVAIMIALAAQQLFAKDKPNQKSLVERIKSLFKKEKTI